MKARAATNDMQLLSSRKLIVGPRRAQQGVTFVASQVLAV